MVLKEVGGSLASRQYHGMQRNHTTDREKHESQPVWWTHVLLRRAHLHVGVSGHAIVGKVRFLSESVQRASAVLIENKRVDEAKL